MPIEKLVEAIMEIEVLPALLTYKSLGNFPSYSIKFIPFLSNEIRKSFFYHCSIVVAAENGKQTK